VVKQGQLDISKLQQEDVVKNSKTKEMSEEFFKEHLSLVEAIVANIKGSGKIPPGMEFDDLVSWGVEGLIKAHKNFDESKGSKFKTYAFYRIRGEILDRIRSEWRYRNPNDYNKHRKEIQERIAEIAEEMLDEEGNTANQAQLQSKINRIVSNSAVMCLVSIDNYEVASHAEGTRNPEVEFIDEGGSILWDEIKELSEEEQEIVDLFYVKGLKQKEIADQLNYSRSTVCRLHMKILEKLKKRLKGKI